MEQAAEFSLDVQELQNDDNLNPKTFNALFAKYNAKKVNDTTVVFPDGSAAIWLQEHQCFQIEKNYEVPAG